MSEFFLGISGEFRGLLSYYLLNLIFFRKLTAEEAAKTLAIACEAVRSADPKLCKLLAQKAVHMNPTYRELLLVCQ